MKHLLILLAVLFIFAVPGEALSDTIDDLARKLDSYDRDVQMSAIESLGKIGDEKAADVLFHFIYRKGENWRLKTRALRLLGDIRDPSVTDKLVSIFNDPFLNDVCPALKWNTAVALGQGFNRGSRAVEALIGALDSDDLLIREAAIQSLGKIGDPFAVSHLIPRLSDERFSIKYSTLIALKNIGSFEAIAPIKKLADTDRDAFLRDEALKAIKIISARIATRQ